MAVGAHVHMFVADVVKSFDTVDRGILDRVLSGFGLLTWLKHACFEYHAHMVSLGLGMGVFHKDAR